MVMSACRSTCAVEELRVVHPVEMIAGENQVVVRLVRFEMPARFAHGVSGAFEPGRAVGRLFGGEDLDKPVREEIHPVGVADVTIERRGVELREHVDAPHVGVEAVADRHIDEPVLAADRHRGLRSELGERETSGSPGRRRESAPVLIACPAA